MAKKKLFAGGLAVLVLVLLLAAFGQIFVWAKQKMMQKIYPVEYLALVRTYAKEYYIDEYLVLAFIKTESSFNPKAVSSAGARGLMQLTEDTFNWIKTKIDPGSALNFNDMYNPQHNIRFGCFFVGYCLARYGKDISTAAAAYHSGVGAVDFFLQNPAYSKDGLRLHAFPNNVMAHYVTKIKSNYKTYLNLYATKK